MRDAPRLKAGSVIAFEGDSLTNRRMRPTLDTWPYLRLMGWEGNWGDQVAEHLFCWRPELRLKFHNAAVGGSICQDLVERFDQFVAPHRPKLVFVTTGNNDAARKIPLRDFTASATRYCRMVGAIGGRVAFLGGFLPPQGRDARPRYYSALKGVARAEGGWYLDAGGTLRDTWRELERQWEGHTVYGDGGHFNAVGNLVVTGAVLKWLRIW
jgi:lysophospholipase L1-like esterase